MGALIFCATHARAADVSGMIEDSDAIESVRRAHSPRPFSLMVSSTFQSPGLDNLDTHLNKMEMLPHDGEPVGAVRHARAASSAESNPSETDARSTGSASDHHGAHQPGYRLRHSLAANYEFAPGYLFGPVLDVSEPLSGRHEGQVLFEDPQLRLTLLDLLRSKVGQNNLHASLLVSAFVPVSDNSRRRSSWGGLSVSSSPRMHIRGTPFSVMATCSLKTGLYGRAEATPLVSSRLSTGIQGGYRVSRRLETGLMLHAGSQFGPDLPIGDSDGLMKDRGTQILGVMPSARYQLNETLSFTPRLDWYLDQPIRTTTLSVSAMMRLI